MATTYIKRCLEVANRAFKEDKFRKGKRCNARFPKNRGLAERVRQYARALLGQALNSSALVSGAEDIIEYWKTWSHPLEPQLQAYWLAAARMTLIAGEPERARVVIDQAPSLKWHQKEADLLRDVATVATESQPIEDSKLLARLDKLFDKVRSPRWRGSAMRFDEPNEKRFELGAIRFRYFISRNGMIDWNSVIEGIQR